jgi:hypothetical protein
MRFSLVKCGMDKEEAQAFFVGVGGGGEGGANFQFNFEKE